MNERGLTAIAIALLMLSLLAPTIALYNQTEEELNNSKSITNTTMPDLFVKGISVSPPLYQNETARINATIKNNGTDSGKFNVSFLVDGALREEKAIEALNENEYRLISFDWTPDTAKNYRLKIIADANNEINESNETNNELEIEVSVLMRITVVIKGSGGDIHIQSLSLEANESILNATAIACGEQNITFDLSDANGNITIDGMNNPKMFLYDEEREEWTETGLNHELEDHDIIGWSDKNDLPLMLPDITPENLTIASFDGMAYTNVTNEIEVRIRNDGLVNASNFTSLFKVNDEIMDEIKIESLNRTQNKSISFYWTPNTTGVYSLTVELDPENNISESNETNNNITLNVTVRAVSIIRIPTDYQTIQEAIDNAPPGSTIIIEDGEYPINDNEHTIRIENKKLLWIIGGKGVRLITDSGTVGDLIRIKGSEQVTLSGFTVGVEKSAKNKKRNIVIKDSNEIRLSNLTLYNYATEGLTIEHIPLTISNASNCKIERCKFTTGDSSAYDLIIGSGSKGNIIENSDINSIFMQNTTNNILRNSIIHKIWVGGNDVYSWSPVEYYSDNNTICNNEIYSISMQGDNNTLYNNTIVSLGMRMRSCPFGGNNNNIYLNNIFGIGRAGVRGNNIWNSTVPLNYSYNGTTFTSYVGNFWYDYSGADNNSDGIGDSPYKVCDSNYDYYPLIEPYGLTFDLAVTAITRPCKIYANRTNTILITVMRRGTYLTPEDVSVNFMVDDTEVDSKTVRIVSGANIVRLAWTPLSVGDYKLDVEVHPEKTLIREMNDTNNRFEIDVTVSSPLFDYTYNISSALDFLRNEQLATGAIWDFENSARAALSIISAGEDPSVWRAPGKYTSSLIGYLRTEPGKIVETGMDPVKVIGEADLARMVMVISAIGQDPTNFGGVNYLTMLKSYHDGEQFGERDDVKDDAFAILALVACGDKDIRTKDMITNTIRYIKARQNDDGGWRSFSVESDVRTTSLVIQALIAAGEDKNSETITKALDYLRKAQVDDGGYSDVISTSYAIQAFIAAGEDSSNYTNTIEHLLSLQQPDGSFNYTTNMSFFPPRMTIFPVFALCGEPYPVMVKTTSGSYELPDVSVHDVVTDDEIIVNTSCTVRADIKSNGGIFYADLLADGEFVARKQVCSVWHDSLTPVSFTWKPTTTGLHNLTIFADSMDNITESDEGNNNVTIEVNVTLPDLYPAVITPPENAFVNVTNIVNCVIKGRTNEHFNVTLEEADSGEVIGKQRIEGIRNNETLSFKWSPSANRTYNLRLVVDPEEEVRERDEDNNTLEGVVNVLLPDMIPVSITADEIFVNARNKVHVTVEGMAECFNVSLIENGTVVGKTTNVTCYGTENVTVYWKPTAVGNHTITAFVDSNGDIEETNERNNNLTGTFEVLQPDLVPVTIEPGVYYIDEYNDVNIGVNGTAENFNVTLLVNYTGVDRSGGLSFLIRPEINQTPCGAIKIPATELDSNSNYSCNITALKDKDKYEWSWEDIKKLDLEIGSVSETGIVDRNDSWGIDYVALIVNYTGDRNNTLELAPRNVTSAGNWSNTTSILKPDGAYARTGNITTVKLEMQDPHPSAGGNITSVAVLLKGYASNMHTPPGYNYSFHLKKEEVNTYNRTIKFGWVPWYEGIYNLTVFLDSSNNVNETNETNNILSKEVLATKRIKLELTSPVGGETWKGIQNITWNASYETALPSTELRIDIFYSPDRGYRWIPIATNETNDGMYAWDTGNGEAPADPPDGEYMIMILAHPCCEISWDRSHQYSYGEILMTLAQSNKPWAMDMSDIFRIYNNEVGMEWGSFHANAGYAPCNGPDSPEIAWVSEDIGASSSSSLIVADGKVFVYATGEHGEMQSGSYTYLVALDQSSGKVLWATGIAPEELGSWSTPAYKDGSIFVVSGGYLYRINANNGGIEWKYPIGLSVDASPAVTRRAIYVGDWSGRRYYCIKNNRTEPRELWNFSVEGRAQATPAVEYGNVYLGSFSSYCGGNCQSRAFCVDAVNGTEIWSTPTGDVCGSITVADGIVYFTTYGGDTVYALDAFNGSVVWKKHIGWSDSTPAYYSPPRSKSTRSYIYAVIVHGFMEPADLHCFDAKTGEEIWNTRGKGGKSGIGYWTASPVVTGDGKVFVGNPSTLSCLDAFTGDVIWQSYGGPSPAVVNGFVYTVHQGRALAYGNGTLPDLTVSAEAPDKYVYVVGKKGNITAKIENIGKSNVTKSFKVELREKGRVIGEQTVKHPLNIGEQRTITFDWIPSSSGSHTLIVEVNPPPGNVTESNPWNNTANVSVEVKDNKPDLVTKIEKVSPNPAYVGDTVTVEANITNIGNETNESFWVRFSVDGVEENMNWTSLEDNVRLLNFTWNATNSGVYNLTVDANPRDRLTIENEVTWTNNNDSIVVEVKPRPTPTPTPMPEKPGFGPGGGGGIGGGTAGGIGEGSGAGESGAGEAGGMQIPVNASATEPVKKEKQVMGYPFGNATSGASGGGGTLPLILIALITLAVALFYFGYYREKRTHKKHRSRNKK